MLSHQLFTIWQTITGILKWSPWAAIDPNTNYTYEGPEAGPGCKMSWESEHDNVGSGSQWIIETKEDQYVKNGMKFGGFEGEYTSEFILEPVSEGTNLLGHTMEM